MKKRNLVVVILAAGKGKRMKSALPKVLHTLDGRPLIRWVLDTAERLGPRRIVVVVGFGGDMVRENLKNENTNERVSFAVQSEQRGTAHAVMQAVDALGSFDGNIMVLSGDVPLIKTETLRMFLDFTSEHKSSAAFLSAEVDDPAGYGRVVRGENGEVISIVEQSDADSAQKMIKEINGGVYLFDGRFLTEALKNITDGNVQNEYYLTEIIKIAYASGLAVSALKIGDADQLSGVNSTKELEQLNLLLVSRKKEDARCRGW
ncbi:MAG: UDP-N-acetylglucosamine pyrophosphorylase [bacterium]|nr:MAG: UDP-N-acetylglucosamine pyrophosphorylase [bacterium]